jgi:transmembrane sensor
MDKILINSFFSNSSSDVERREVILWLLNPENDATVKMWLSENWELVCNTEDQPSLQEPDLDKVWNNIREKINEEVKDPSPVIPLDTKKILFFQSKKYLSIAAACILILVSSLLYLHINKQQKVTALKVPVLHDGVAAPDKTKATLTLANGSVIYLDSAGSGTLVADASVHVQKDANGTIVYHADSAAMPAVSFNTLSLPRGSKPVNLVLADGSLVWLNAGSSVTFPTAFAGSERKVSMSGEAYFEIVHMKNKPFHVTAGNALVQVLGTHFNVNSYADELDTKVTLLEGKVNVEMGTAKSVLKPGQQAALRNDNIKVSEDVDVDQVMAWKNGQFYFAGTDIKTIMRQVEKYYDVQVEFHDEIPYQFVAKISRDVNVSELLRRLELTGLVHFDIRDRKIIVRK